MPNTIRSFSQPRSRIRGNRLSITTWLIIINIAVFYLDIVFDFFKIRYVQQLPGGIILDLLPLEGLGHFSQILGFAHLEVWRLITFQFLHRNITHLLTNMMALFFFGPLVENYLGSRRYLAFYLLCGMTGPIAYIALSHWHLLNIQPWTPLVGASAGIFGILVAAARIAPDETVLIFGVIPMQLRTMAWWLLAIAAYTVVFFGASPTHNAGGQAAHLGGAAMGYLLICNPHWLNFADAGFFGKRPPF